MDFVNGKIVFKYNHGLIPLISIILDSESEM